MHVGHLLGVLVLLVAAGSVAQEPAGVHRTKVGSVEIIALEDGELKLDPSLLRGLDKADIDRLLGNPGPVTTSVNAFVARSGGHTVLVDAGGKGQAYGGDLGHLAERLRTAGISPESVEAVLITHLHFDHISGLTTPDGKRAFPRARIRLAQAEYDYFLNPALENAASEADRARYTQTKAALAPYLVDGSCRPFAPGEAPFPGVTAIPVPGHTPGHTAYAFGSGRDAVWFVGDIVHFGKVQFQRPDVTVAFDVDGTRARASRMEILQKAASSGAVLAGAHLAFPGMGRVKADGSAFQWVPVSR